MEKVNILVVTDVQNDFCDGSLGSEEAQGTVPAIVSKVTECGNAGDIIVHTKDSHDGNYLGTSEGKLLPVIHTVIGTEGWEIVPAVKQVLELYGSVEVLKGTFGSRNLASVISVLAGVKSESLITDGRNLRITVIGWCTDICVISNAILLKTAFPEAEVIVDSKCCAGVTPELHQAALNVMASCQIIVK